MAVTRGARQRRAAFVDDAASELGDRALCGERRVNGGESRRNTESRDPDTKGRASHVHPPFEDNRRSVSRCCASRTRTDQSPRAGDARETTVVGDVSSGSSRACDERWDESADESQSVRAQLNRIRVAELLALQAERTNALVQARSLRAQKTRGAGDVPASPIERLPDALALRRVAHLLQPV